MSFQVVFNEFEGPLDLMLHLIKENKLDLFDLEFDVLVDQYLLYLEQAEALNLEIDSEYLVELATMIEYKSKRLLPKKEEDLVDEYEEDPKDRLVRRLMEYQQFKDVSSVLENYYKERQLQIGKPLSLENEEWIKNNENMPIEGNPYDLVKAMSKVLRRLSLSKPIETKMKTKEISVDDRILQIKARWMELPETFSFEMLSSDCENVEMVIVTFLASLDLIRRQELVFTVDENDVIWFKRGVKRGNE